MAYAVAEKPENEAVLKGTDDAHEKLSLSNDACLLAYYTDIHRGHCQNLS